MSNTTVIISICVLILVFSIFNNVECVNVIVNSNIGPIEGSFDGNYVKSFIGIPFAQPPIGKLRFTSPKPIIEPISNTSHPYDATIDPNTVPACPQLKSVKQNEDCLYLNIYTPSDAEYGKTSYTVMIWIYGGSFQSGYSTLSLYNPTNWIELIDDIIIVSMNYRLGILGWFYDNKFNTGLFIFIFSNFYI